MKIQKTTNRYCPTCKAHKNHKITQAKTKKRGELKAGQRRYRSITAGYGGFPRPIVKNKSKTSKKLNILFECSVCKKKHVRQNNKRSKRIEQV